MDTRLRGLIIFAVLLAGVAIAIIASRGGDSNSSKSDTTASVATDTTSTPTDTTASTPKPPKRTKPKVNVPSGPPPKNMVVKNLITGTGPKAKKGDVVTVQYVGVDYKTGKQFDASWDRGQPFPFTLGAGQVIPGWDQGVVGMQVGGRRELIIPPNLAYGPQGSPPAIGKNATLIFVIDLLSIK